MEQSKNIHFATAINCIDGRIQEPVIKYIQTTYGIDFVDLITEPGPNKILSENCENEIIDIDSIRITSCRCGL